MRRSQFAWSYRPCDELGGDILNVVPLAQDQVAFYLLDVAGHGVPAALLSVAISRLLTTATNSSSLVRERIDTAPGYRVVPPREVLSRLNHVFLDTVDFRFFTMIYGVWDLSTHRLTYASGGHNPAILLSDDGTVKTLGPTGTVIGALAEATFEQADVFMRPLDRLFIYSDGITEAANSDGYGFGLQRLIDFAKAPVAAPIQDIADNLVRHIEDWCEPAGLKDDVSCLVAEATEIEL